MYSIENRLAYKDDWIVANIGPKKHMLEAVAAEIYNHGKIKHLFLNTEFSFSFTEFSFSLKGEKPASDIMTLLKKMSSYLKSKNKKFL